MAVRAIAIEDDEAVARLIAQVLASHGFDVCGTAATGEEGVALARKEKPDVALVDLGLPKMSGEEVLSGEAAPISPRAAKVLLSELRGDPPDQRGGPALSKRELEVLELLVHGHTYADVASALGIAEGTVQTYVKRIYEKLDVSTKAEAALLAVARGLVRP